MKLKFLVATAATVCCGFSLSAIAQDRYDSGLSYSSTRSAGIQVDTEASPLDLGLDSQETEPDPHSLSDGQNRSDRQSTEGKSPVDTIIENAGLADNKKTLVNAQASYAGGGIDGSYLAPLYWGQSSYTHNALANYMRTQWCADGLWDSFPAERAAQCALQAERISGAHRHHCGHCGHVGVHAFSGDCCAGRQCHGHRHGCHAGAGDCSSTACDQAPVNRYRMHRRHGCGKCNSAECSGCDAGSQSPACDSISQSTFVAPTTTSNTHSSLPASESLDTHGTPDKVAFLPMMGNR